MSAIRLSRMPVWVLCNLMEIYNSSSNRTSCARAQRPAIFESAGAKAIGGYTNAAQVRELLAWIEGDIDEHHNAGAIARDTVETMMALYESTRRNAVVHLPLEEIIYPLERIIEEGKLPVEIESRYDIRSFLKWDGIDEEKYKVLRAQGMAHHQIMRQLHEKIQG